MSAVQQINPQADVIGQRHALSMNIAAGRSLGKVVESNLGPKGTLKMLVSGALSIFLTKDGKRLLDQMQIQHPTAAIIARTATAQDDITGDGTTSNVLFTAELLKQAELYINEGVHPRVIVEGFEVGREETLRFLESYQIKQEGEISKELLDDVARTSLRTKVYNHLADHLTEIVVSAVGCIHVPDQPLDLHMVEVMEMRHKTATDSRFVSGLVLDHGARHPNMAKRSEDCAILTLNVSLEYEKSEVYSEFQSATPEQRKALVAAERKFTDDRVMKVIEFKRRLIDENPDSQYKSFIVINQKGIDPLSLDLLQKAGIVGIRRAKRRNMERLAKACGGYSVNSVETLEEDCLGYAKLVYEHTLGDEKYTFVEGCRNPTSCTVLITGPNDHTINMIKDAVRDGLRAVKNTVEDKSVVPGAGAFELAAHHHLYQFMDQVKGRTKMGVRAFADALLTVPKTLARNSGFDAQETVIALLDENKRDSKVGIDVDTGKACLPATLGIWDNYRVKRQLLHLGSMIAIKLLLVDEIMRAGRKMGGK